LKHVQKLALPVDLLDVIIHAHSQPAASLCAAVFDYFSAALGGHARPETMSANPVTFFWLVRSLWHFFFLLLDNYANDCIFSVSIIHLEKTNWDYTLILHCSRKILKIRDW
jgi:hypothetical protein